MKRTHAWRCCHRPPEPCSVKAATMGQASAQALRLGMRVVLTGLLLGWAPCALSTLPLPSNLISLETQMGEQMLLEAKYKADYFLLAEHFVQQINGAFCGVASSAMCLNALGTPRPMQDTSTGLARPEYAYYTQDNVFNSDTEKVVPKKQVMMQGLSIDELSRFLAAHPGVSSTFTRTTSATISLSMFRDAAIQALALPSMFCIVNFDRALLGERGSGHHSPVAAYHQPSDSFLVLDVSRYKYSAWWVSAQELYASTANSVDTDTQLTRGLIFVWASDKYQGHPNPLAAASAAPTTDNGQSLLVFSQQTSSNAHGLSAAGVTALAVGMLLAGLLMGAVAMSWYTTRKQHRLDVLSPPGSFSVGVGHPNKGSFLGTLWPPAYTQLHGAYKQPIDTDSPAFKPASSSEDEAVSFQVHQDPSHRV